MTLVTLCTVYGKRHTILVRGAGGGVKLVISILWDVVSIQSRRIIRTWHCTILILCITMISFSGFMWQPHYVFIYMHERAEILYLNLLKLKKKLKTQFRLLLRRWILVRDSRILILILFCPKPNKHNLPLLVQGHTNDFNSTSIDTFTCQSLNFKMTMEL